MGSSYASKLAESQNMQDSTITSVSTLTRSINCAASYIGLLIQVGNCPDKVGGDFGGFVALLVNSKLITYSRHALQAAGIFVVGGSTIYINHSSITRCEDI